MKKILLAVAVAAIATMAVAASASAAPGVTTHNIALNAATDGVVDLPALNSQFTKMTIEVNDGTANWGSADLGYWTSYQGGNLTTGSTLTSGKWGDESLPGHGPLLLEGTQVGAAIYRVDLGAWQEVLPGTTVSGAHTVQVAYNDRPGSYDDNSGSLSLTVVRTKA